MKGASPKMPILRLKLQNAAVHHSLSVSRCTFLRAFWLATQLPKIDSAAKLAHPQPAPPSSYSTLYYARPGAKPNSTVVEPSEETQLLKDLWSGPSGKILTKLEKTALGN